MAFAFITNASALKQGNSAGSGNTSAIDTTGANFIALVVCDYNGAGQVTPTDSKSNTWTALTSASNTSSGRITIWYCYGATVGASHTFAANGTGTYASISVAAFSGSASSPLDQQNAFNSANANNISCCGGTSITPGQDNELLVYGLGDTAPHGTASVSVGTILQQAAFNSGVSWGNAIAYEIQTTATTRNPNFTWDSTLVSCVAAIATFKAAAGGGAARVVKMAGEYGGYAGSSGGFAG